MTECPVTARRNAKEARLKTYRIDGIPCRRGHMGDRRVYDGRCIVCLAEEKKTKGRKRGRPRKSALQVTTTELVKNPQDEGTARRILQEASRGLPDAPFDFD